MRLGRVCPLPPSASPLHGRGGRAVLTAVVSVGVALLFVPLTDVLLASFLILMIMLPLLLMVLLMVLMVLMVLLMVVLILLMVLLMVLILLILLILLMMLILLMVLILLILLTMMYLLREEVAPAHLRTEYLPLKNVGLRRSLFVQHQLEDVGLASSLMV